MINVVLQLLHHSLVPVHKNATWWKNAAGRYRCLEQPGRDEWCRVGRGFCLVRYGADSADQGLRIVAGISRNGSNLWRLGDVGEIQKITCFSPLKR